MLREPTAGLDALIRAEQVRVVFRNMPMVLVSNIAVPLLMLLALPEIAARTEARAWFALMLAAVLARLGMQMAFRQAALTPARITNWAHYLTISALVSGCFWGAAGAYLADPGQPLQFSLIIFVLAGLGASSAIAYAAYLPVFLAYFVPSLLPFIVAVLFTPIQLPPVNGVAALMYMVSIIFFARNLNGVLRQSLRLCFENLDLVQALTAQKESAERANAAKTHFLAAASHDLRQPLHAIGLFISALAERVRGTATRKLVSQLSASTDALRGLLNALLDISRLDAGVIQPRIGHCPLQALFDRLANGYGPVAAEKNIRLKFMPTRAVVRSDPALLERIVRNLVSNAIRYTARGGVAVGCRPRGDEIRIEVWDSGMGIPDHEIGNIFREFYQISNPERDRGKGLGLGLAIVERLGRLLDHRIDMVSVPGKGSRFAVTLPRGQAAESETTAPAPVTIGRLRAARVLVIDDEAAIREATHTLLTGWGCNTVLADSAASALDALAHDGHTPDLIIADFRLRDDKTGVQAIEQVQARYGRKIPAVIITGDTAPQRLREAQASGYHLLHKPLAPAQLRALLSHLLGEVREPKTRAVVT